MKKSILICSLLLLITVCGYGQYNPFSLKVNGGVNFSTMDIGDFEGKVNPRVGYQFGVTGEYTFVNNVFVSAGLQYTMKGTKFKESVSVLAANESRVTHISNNVKIKAGYLVMPLMGGYKLSVPGGWKFNFSVGPYLGYGVSGKTTSESSRIISGKLPTGNELIEINPENKTVFENSYLKHNTFSAQTLKRFDLGIMGNIGCEYNRILLNIGYEYGFINASRIKEHSIYNTNAYLTLGYRIL